MGPRCPDCQTRLPFHRTQNGLGTVFACENCGQGLVVPRGQNWVFLIGLFVLFWVAKDRLVTHWLGTVALFAGICTLGLPALWLKTQVRMASANDPTPADKKKPPQD